MPFVQQYKRKGPDAFEPAPAKRLGLVSLVAVIFFTVSGGAYGLEPLVGAMGAAWAIALITIIGLAREGAPGAALATARNLGQHGSNSLLALGLSTPSSAVSAASNERSEWA